METPEQGLYWAKFAGHEYNLVVLVTGSAPFLKGTVIQLDCLDGHTIDIELVELGPKIEVPDYSPENESSHPHLAPDACLVCAGQGLFACQCDKVNSDTPPVEDYADASSNLG